MSGYVRSRISFNLSESLPCFASLGGNYLDAAQRPFPVVWNHSARDR
jgi:hypothetical protein